MHTLKQMAASTEELMEFAVMYEARDKGLLKAMAAYRGGGRDDNASKTARNIKGQREERAKKGKEKEQAKAAKEKAAKQRAEERAAKKAAKKAKKDKKANKANKAKKDKKAKPTAKPKREAIASDPAKRLAEINKNKKTQAFPPCAGSGARPRPPFLPKVDAEMTEEDLFGYPDSGSESDGESIWTSSSEKVARPWAKCPAAGSRKQVRA